MRVFDEGKMYFATSYRKDEIKCLKVTQPPNILAAFPMWRNGSVDKDLKKDLIDLVGYPIESLVVDSGAFTFRTEDYGHHEAIETYAEMREEDGYSFDIENEMDLIMFAHWWYGEFEEYFYVRNKNDFTLFQQYLNFLSWNRSHYSYCFALDKMGDNEESKLSFRIMDALGFPVIPVYQATHIYFGDEVDEKGNPKISNVEANTTDFDVLDYYAKHSDIIGIGGTAISKVKGYTKKKRIEIVRTILDRHPDKKFHLLGTLDPDIVEACPELYSFDGQTWVRKVKKEQKIVETVKYVNNKLAWFEAKKQEVQKDITVTENGQLSFDFAV